MPTTLSRRPIAVATAAFAVLIAIIAAICLAAPTETTMGHAQRILYIHVAVAWLALAGVLIVAVAGVLHLRGRDLAWDHWAQAAGELGWLACTLTLATGSLWAHSAWHTWWTWDPRLSSALVLWLIYSGWLAFRGQIDEPHRRARLSAALAILGAVDVPLVIVAARWFRGIHPPAVEMEPAMRLTMLLTVVGLTAIFGALLIVRRGQVALEAVLDAREEEVRGQESAVRSAGL